MNVFIVAVYCIYYVVYVVYVVYVLCVIAANFSLLFLEPKNLLFCDPYVLFILGFVPKLSIRCTTLK